MLSFWEKNNYSHFDCIVIGGGISGTSSAISLKKKFPHKSVLIIERGILPSGASTKNAGFACFGSLTEILSDIEKMGSEKALQILEMRIKGLNILRKRLGDEKINYIQNGGYELIFNNNDFSNGISEVNDALKDVTGINTFQLKNKLIDSFGFNSQKVKQLIFNPFEAQIDSGLMIKNLWKYASELGVMIFTGTEAAINQMEADSVKISLKSATSGFMNVNCNHLIVCTNAFTKEIFPEEDFQPGRGQVVVTKPIPNLKIKGTFHFDEGFFYFRNYENRIIFGGGRNHFYEQEKTTKFEITENVISLLKSYLEDMILPQTKFEIDYSWAGIMAFGTKDKFPVIKKKKENIILAGRLSGMGIAIGSFLGEEVAKMID